MIVYKKSGVSVFLLSLCYFRNSGLTTLQYYASKVHEVIDEIVLKSIFQRRK